MALGHSSFICFDSGENRISLFYSGSVKLFCSENMKYQKNLPARKEIRPPAPQRHITRMGFHFHFLRMKKAPRKSRALIQSTEERHRKLSPQCGLAKRKACGSNQSHNSRPQTSENCVNGSGSFILSVNQ